MQSIWIISSLLFIIIIFYILISGAEYALLSSNPLTLELKRDQKRKRNNNLGKLLDNQDVFWRTTNALSYLLLFIVTLLIVMLIKRILVLPIIPIAVKTYFQSYEYMRLIGCGIITLIIVNFIKRGISRPIYTRKPENKVNTLSKLIMPLSKFFNPIVVAFRKIADFILIFLFNARVNKEAPIFQGIDPKYFFRQSIQGHNVLDKLNKEFFRGAIDLTQVNVRNCVTPRTEIVAIDIRDGVDSLKNKFIETKISKIIIYEKHLDNIIGYVHHLDMNTNPSEINDILLPLPYFPESMSALELVRKFTRERKSVALVIDEFGGTTGLVTLEDILEEIFGNIRDEYDSDELVEKKISDNEYIFSGRLKIDYLNHKYNFNINKDDSETLSGYIINRHENIPNQKQKIIIGRFEFEILLVTATKIESVKMKLLNH